MQARITYYLYKARTSFWFIPILMLTLTVAAAFMIDNIDRWLKDDWAEPFPWLFEANADGARALLSTIAGSIISVVSLVFSITLLVLSNASSQLGPRLLTSFLSDRFVQTVLGVFLSCAVFSLLVLRTIEAGDTGYVPKLSIGIALIYAIGTLVVLAVFFHHLSVAIQADTIIANVRTDLDRRIHDFFDRFSGDAAWGARERTTSPKESGKTPATVFAPSSGYVQTIDYGGLLDIAVEHDLVAVCEARPGDFLARREPMILVWPQDSVDEGITDSMASAVVLGDKRTDADDIEYAFSQMIEIAVRALSPGINDPKTALACIDHCSAALCEVVELPPPVSEYSDDDGKTRLHVETITFESLLNKCFGSIRQHAGGQVDVLLCLLDGLIRISQFTAEDKPREAIERHAGMILQTAKARVDQKEDLAVIEDAMDALKTALKADPPERKKPSSEK